MIMSQCAATIRYISDAMWIDTCLMYETGKESEDKLEINDKFAIRQSLL